MKRQTVAQTKKETTTLPMRGLSRHTAVRVISEHERAPSVSAETRFGHDFSQVAVRLSALMVGQHYATSACPVFPRRCPFGGACHACPLPVQAKLAVSRSGDRYEQEADRVAEEATRVPGVYLQRRAASQTEPTHVPPIVHEVLRSPGQPLDPATRAFMEPRFGHDFSRVRVHTDAKAAESARAVNALAYTVGRDVVFDVRQYAPETTTGRQLLAHEMTHVIQQTRSAGQNPIRNLDSIQIAERLGENEAISAETNMSISKPVFYASPQSVALQRVVAGPRVKTASAIDPERLEEFRSLIAEYLGMRESGALSPERTAEVDRAIRRAEAAIREAERVSGTETSLAAGAGVALGATIALAADDVTFIGVADDIAIPFTLLAAGVLALGALIQSRTTTESNQAAVEAVSEAINTIQGVLAAAATAVAVEEMVRTLESEGVKEEVRRLSPEGPGNFEFCFRIFARCLVTHGFERRWIGLGRTEMPETMALIWEECMSNFLTCISRGIRIVR